MIEQELFKRRQRKLYQLAAERCVDIVTDKLGSTTNIEFIKAEAMKLLQRELREAELGGD
jgi:hypothetical protein